MNIEKFWSQAFDVAAKNPDIVDNLWKDALPGILNELETNESFKKFQKLWNEMSEENKEKIYKHGDYAFSLTWGMKRNIQMLNPISGPLRQPIARILSKDSFKQQFTKDGMEIASWAMRTLVNLGVIEKPKNISDEVLLQNIKKDGANMKTKMWVLEKAAMVIPELKPALPIIQKIKPLMDASSDAAVKAMVKRQGEKKISENVEGTKAELQKVITPENPEKAIEQNSALPV